MKEKRNMKAKAAGIVVCMLLLATSVLLVSRSVADWQEGDDYKMHFPQLPDLYGWDVNATWPLVVADDWMCTATGYVSDIHFWGSWKNDTIGTINSFWIGIYSDVPSNQTMYSHPGELLWSRWFHPDEWIEVANETPQYTEGWYDPHTGKWWKPNHWMYFQYNIANITDPFVQWNGTIYWLAISANVTGGYWGWKTSQNHWNDDAVWSWIDEIYWTDLWDPQEGISLDMAFVITGEEFPCCNKDWDYWTNPPNMWAIPNGNVGIGTNNPQAKLDVRGSAVFNDDGGDYDFRIEGKSETDLFFVDASTNRIGIGTNNPAKKLHIYHPTDTSTLRIETGATNKDAAFNLKNPDIMWKFYVSSADYFIIRDITNGKTTFYMKPNPVNNAIFVGSNSIVINGDGEDADFRVESQDNANMLFVDASTDHVGIGTNNPQRPLHVNDVMRLEPRASAPSSPSEGDIYYDSTLHVLRVYDGTQWQNCWSVVS